jgi:hypothetical protein
VSAQTQPRSSASTAWQKVRRGWGYLTGFRDWRSWHTNAWLDAKWYSDRTVFLLAVCAFFALGAWWRALDSSGNLAAAGWAFVGVLVGSFYGWMVLSTVRRDRRRLLARLSVNVTGALYKTELVQARRGSVRVGRAVGMHRGVIWERFTPFPILIRSTYPSTLLDASNPRDRERVEAAMVTELEGLGENPKHRYRYRITWQPSSGQYTTQREEYVPKRVQASEDTMNREVMIIGYTANGITGFRPRAHVLIIGGTGAGKSGSVRGWIASGLSSGVYECAFIIDMKGDGDYGSFMGREGIRCVATEDKPGSIPSAFAELDALFKPRFAARQAAAESHGAIPEPIFGEVMIVMDEAQDLVAEYGDKITTMVKKWRSVGARIFFITQRPDSGKSVPGAGARDQFPDRFVLGPLSPEGAEMAFGTESPLYKEAQKLPSIPGRFLARIDGQRVLGQAPFLPPDNVPWAAELYPPLLSSRTAAAEPELEDEQGSLASPDEADLHALRREVDEILNTQPDEKAGDSSTTSPNEPRQPNNGAIVEEDD